MTCILFVIDTDSGSSTSSTLTYVRTPEHLGLTTDQLTIGDFIYIEEACSNRKNLVAKFAKKRGVGPVGAITVTGFTRVGKEEPGTTRYEFLLG